MTEAQVTTLKEFIQKTAQDLYDGKMTAEEVLVSARQYEALRSLINPQDLQNLLSQDTTKLKEYLLEIFKIALTREGVPPQVQEALAREIPDEPESLQEIVLRAKFLNKAREDLINSRDARLRQLKKSYVKKLIDTWVANSKEKLSEQKSQETAQKLHEKIDQLEEGKAEMPELAKYLTQEVDGLLGSTESWAPEFAREARPTSDIYVSTRRQIINITNLAATTLAQTPELVRPDIFIRAVLEKSTDPGADSTSVIQKSYKTARAAEAFSSLVETGEDVTRPADFFSPQAKIWQKPFAKTADFVLSLLPKDAREAVVQSFLTRSLEKSVDGATRALGQEVVGSAYFQQAVRSAALSFGNRSARASGLKNAFLDFGGLFVGNQQTTFTAYFDLVLLNEKLPPWQKIFPPDFLSVGVKKAPPGAFERTSLLLTQGVPPEVTYFQFFWQQYYLANLHTGAVAPPAYRLDFLGSLGSWVFRWGAKKATHEGAKRAGLLVAEATATRVGVGTAIKIFGLVLPEPVSKLMLLGSTALAPVAKGVGGLIGKFFQGDFWQLGTAQRALKSYFGVDRLPPKPKQWYEKSAVLVVLLVLAPVLLTGFAFISGNSFFAGEAARTSALVDPRFKGEGSFDNAPIPVECQGDNLPKPAASGIKTASFGGKTYAFPVGEFDRTYYTCGHWDGAYATDIGITGVNTGDPGVHLPVVAYVGGKISSVATGDSKGGKYIILEGDDGRNYYYAHNCALYVQRGQRVAAGEVIAASGNTGSAADTPEHLHFAISNGSTFYNGGTTCPSKDFQEKLGIFRCSKEEQCP